MHRHIESVSKSITFSEFPKLCSAESGEGKIMALKENSFMKLIFIYEGHLESKERFAIQRYLLIIGKKQNMLVLSYTFTYLST